MLNIKDLTPDWVLSEQLWDLLEPVTTNLPVDVWIDNNQLFPEKRGFWFKISKSKDHNQCSYIDTDGKFYHNIDDFYLSANELQQIIAFALEYKDLIEEMHGSENFYTENFISLLRYKDPFTQNKLFAPKDTQTWNATLEQLKEYRVISQKYTSLPMSIWIDNGHVYPTSDFEPKEESAYKNFAENNQCAIQALSEGKINVTFFKDYCIPGGEENHGLAKTFEVLTKWEIEKPMKDDLAIMEKIKVAKHH